MQTIDATPPRRTTFTAAGVKRGFIAAQALAPGVLLYGVVYGVLASETGLRFVEALLVSAFVYSGSAQVAVLQSWHSSFAIASLVVTVLLMNARYLLYGAALRPWLGSLPASRVYPGLFFLGDAAWALALARHREGEDDGGFVFGSGVAGFLPWIGGTVIGYFAGNAVPDPQALGLDALLATLAAATIVMMWQGRGDVLPTVVAVIVALLFHRFGPSGWTIVAAGIAGGITAYLLARRRTP
ncbi:MAG TPA: AzlC family ABC transporter permease [Casimicrobiaceae bacterium]|nr:AzlC family ABC transporter permease [Casimicrobiaceae bacterium]